MNVIKLMAVESKKVDKCSNLICSLIHLSKINKSNEQSMVRNK